MVRISSRYGLWGGYELYLKTVILESVYPVGSVYISLTDSRNPSDILGFGTWEAMPAGYGLVAQGTATAEDGSSLKFTAGQKSGEFKHEITIEESAKHNHGQNIPRGNNTGYIAMIAGFQSYNEEHPVYKGESGWVNAYGIEHNKYSQVMTDDSGAGQPHNNISPCIAAYAWKRIK